MSTMDMEGTSILKKSKESLTRYGLVNYRANFSWIDFLSPVRYRSLVDSLNLLLTYKVDQAVRAGNSEGLILSYPEIIYFQDVDHIRYGGFGTFREYDHVDMVDFLTEYAALGYAKLDHELDKLNVQLVNGTGTNGRTYSLYRSLSTEIEHNNQFYIFSNGIWFKLDGNHYLTVSRFFDQLILNTAEFRGTETTYEKNETEYL